jgi:hypothetical protein
MLIIIVPSQAEAEKMRGGPYPSLYSDAAESEWRAPTGLVVSYDEVKAWPLSGIHDEFIRVIVIDTWNIPYWVTDAVANVASRTGVDRVYTAKERE